MQLPLAYQICYTCVQVTRFWSAHLSLLCYHLISLSGPSAVLPPHQSQWCLRCITTSSASVVPPLYYHLISLSGPSAVLPPHQSQWSLRCITTSSASVVPPLYYHLISLSGYDYADIYSRHCQPFYISCFDWCTIYNCSSVVKTRSSAVAEKLHIAASRSSNVHYKDIYCACAHYIRLFLDFPLDFEWHWTDLEIALIKAVI